jgi:hypothetical protein
LTAELHSVAVLARTVDRERSRYGGNEKAMRNGVILVRRYALVFLAVFTLLAVPVHRANANPSTSFSTGGAAADPHPRPLTAAELAAAAHKRAVFERSLAFITSSRNAPLHGTPSILSAAGSVFTEIYEEPQYAPWVSESQNWCGPGSTAAIVSNWNTIPQTFSNPTYGSGGQGYITWLAKQGVPGIGPMVVTGANGRPITYDTTERDTLNNQTSSLFYIIQNPVGGLTNFISYVNSDLAGFDQQHHPLVGIVWTSGMPGWGTWGVNHYQWIVAFNDATNFLQYGDSAGSNANPFGNPFGWHTTVTLSDYYAHVTMTGLDEIIW